MFEARGVGVPGQPDGHEAATRGAREELPGCAGGLSQSPGATGSGVNKYTERVLQRLAETSTQTQLCVDILFSHCINTIQLHLFWVTVHLI